MTELEMLKKAAKEQYDRLIAKIAELENESKEKTEKKYTWEKCFKGEGFTILDDCRIPIVHSADVCEKNINIAATKKVCKSYLAACQLSHIIERLNEDFEGDMEYFIVYNRNYGVFFMDSSSAWGLPYIKSQKACEKLIEENTALLKQYFGIE